MMPCESYIICLSHDGDTRWRSRLWHCATRRKLASSIPNGVIWISHWHKPSGRTVVLWSTELPTQVSTRCISWCTALITLPPYVSVVWKFWEPPSPGNLRACPGLCMDSFGLCESCDVSHTISFCSIFYHCIYGCDIYGDVKFSMFLNYLWSREYAVHAGSASPKSVLLF